MIRRYVLGSLESSVHRYSQHKRREVIESFLLLVGRDNATLRQILGNPHHAALVTDDRRAFEEHAAGSPAAALEFSRRSPRPRGHLERDRRPQRLRASSTT